MIQKIYTIFALLLLITACTSAPPTTPTTTKIERIRAARLPLLKQHVKLAGYNIGAPMHIKIYKQEHILELWMKRPNAYGYTLFKTYPICKYSGTLGPKLREGDRQAPEGFYAITPERMNPWSKYHLSMNIGFPNAWDTAQGRTGSYLMIHGDCRSEGCFAMGNAAIEDIYLLTEAAFTQGAAVVPVDIYPFRMSAENLHRHRHSPWIEFWEMLSRGGYE